MPIYEYRCGSCGFQKEFLQKVSDPQHTVCPECGKESFKKMLTAAAFTLCREEPAWIVPTLGVILVVLWVGAFFLGYWVLLEGGESGQTFGKRAVGIRVRAEGGGRVGYGKALVRNLVARVIGLFPFVGLIDVLWPLWDDKNQCLHDKAASTIVVRA